jgi:hypothetical protein
VRARREVPGARADVSSNMQKELWRSQSSSTEKAPLSPGNGWVRACFGWSWAKVGTAEDPVSLLFIVQRSPSAHEDRTRSTHNAGTSSYDLGPTRKLELQMAAPHV